MGPLQVLSLATIAIAVFHIEQAPAAGFGDWIDNVKLGIVNTFEGDGKTEEKDQASSQPSNAVPHSNSASGLTREENREIQQRLIDSGYEPGPADGLPGKNTKSAIRSYQKDEGLPVDGRPSKELLATMRDNSSSMGASVGNVGKDVGDGAKGVWNRMTGREVRLGLPANITAAQRKKAEACAEKVSRLYPNDGKIILVGEESSNKGLIAGATAVGLGVAISAAPAFMAGAGSGALWAANTQATKNDINTARTKSRMQSCMNGYL